MSAVALHVPEATRYTSQSQVRAWLEVSDGFRHDILERLRNAGPLLSRDVPDTSEVPWSSTGWTNNRNVTQMLELLSVRGEVAVAGRIGRQRLWDIADRVYPNFEPLPADEAQRRSGVGATSLCRCSTTTGSSASSTPRQTARPGP